MKKIAFFVEGQTEQLFIEKLLNVVFKQKKIVIEIKKIRGGNKIPISITTIKTPNITAEASFYILIYDCGGDTNIRSYIQDRRESLIDAGYKSVIGIRDVYPKFTRDEIPRLLFGLNFKLPQKELPIKFILSIMEIEAWFLAEQNHFLKINKALTPEYIKENVGFDPSTYNTELLDEPANKLGEIYRLVHKEYNKHNHTVMKTINSIDFSNMYLQVHKRIESFKQLIEVINSEIV